MKKILSVFAFCALVSTTTKAATFIREVSPSGGGAGTSSVSMCNFMMCTAATFLTTASGSNTLTNGMTGLTSIYITFDYAFYPGSPSTFIVTPGSIGSSYTTFVQGGDYLKIRRIAPDVYSYYVYTIYL